MCDETTNNSVNNSIYMYQNIPSYSEILNTLVYYDINPFMKEKIEDYCDFILNNRMNKFYYNNIHSNDDVYRYKRILNYIVTGNDNMTTIEPHKMHNLIEKKKKYYFDRLKKLYIAGLQNIKFPHCIENLILSYLLYF